MTFISAVIGAIFGSFIFSTRSSFLMGGIFGGLIAYALTRIMLLEDRIATLEKKLALKTSPKKVSVQPKPQLIKIPEPATSRPEKIPELDFNLVAEDNSPPQPISARAVKPHDAPPTTPVTPQQTAKEKEHAVEWWDIIISYFTGGNVVVRVGILVIFFGVAFLIKYSAERNIIPIEYRLASICIGAIAMLVFGWRLRQSRAVYALILQGGGIGVLYLTIFAALKLYHLLPIGVALGLMILLPVFSAFLAIVQDARSLAVIGITGGFLAPVLTSTGGGSHVVLFSYYALLNGGILLTAWHRSWRELNLIGFIFTFAIGSAWGARSFQPELFSTTEPFLILFFLFYLTIGLLFASKQPLRHKGYIDCSMVFGTPIICFALQSKLVQPYEYGLAWSALSMGIIYAALAMLVFRKGSEAMRTMVESFLAMGVVFGTIAIPLALDGRWTSTAWALEGAAIIWIAIRQNRQVARIFGLAIQILAGLSFLSALNEPSGPIAIINGVFLGALIMAIAGFFSSYCLFASSEKIKSAGQESTFLLVWALVWWFGAGLHEIDSFVAYYYKPAAALIFCSLSSMASYAIAGKLRWDELKHVYKGLLAVMGFCAFYLFINFSAHPFAYGGFASWPIAFAVLYRLLYLEEQKASESLLQIFHTGSLLLLIALATWETYWWTDHLLKGAGIWNLATMALVPSLFILVISKFNDAIPWPVEKHLQTYLYRSLAPVVTYLWIGTLLINLTNRGNPWPLPYLPFLNPLDLTQIFVFMTMIYWSLVLSIRQAIDPFSLTRRQRIVTLGGTVFLWLNAVLIRTLHYWGGVGFDSRSMFSSDLVHTSLSIFWTLSAFAVMSWGNRRQMRHVWMAGGGLIGVVVIKLFTVDLANTGTIERIVSFLGVGAICLVIGYLAPLPIQAEVEEQSE